ncbi:ArsR/SmtB family transcription factor [Kocuria rosea]|jgi:DNA-binding transcriptional ArsR family regulator|uniref:ArsR/SmtB family transcription factor n=1 Tax=Kocuria rosea TaxID=1275 RepID=UPI00203E9647|nr:helix-turn-helix domain-containing protein [Kocuria rosea]MCM3688195.1 helix-turn-helix domain-containing protein [Kocuria rosea]HST72959.1 helix-turn-helix domain-containing protein [Kocuria rosea]
MASMLGKAAERIKAAGSVTAAAVVPAGAGRHGPLIGNQYVAYDAGVDSIFQALAHPARRILVEELAGRNDQTLFELTVRLINNHGLAMTRQAVTKHLAVLREAGLVTTTTRGRTTVHHLDTAPLTTARKWLDALPPTSEDPA